MDRRGNVRRRRIRHGLDPDGFIAADGDIADWNFVGNPSGYHGVILHFSNSFLKIFNIVIIKGFLRGSLRI